MAPRTRTLARKLAAIKASPVAPAFLVAAAHGQLPELPKDYEAQMTQMVAEAESAANARLALLAIKPASAGPHTVVLL